jgi:hypothetical protein
VVQVQHCASACEGVMAGDHRFQNVALMIDSPPEIAGLAVDRWWSGGDSN